jgi:hypothetical protein
LEDASIDQTRSVLSDGTFLGMIDWQEFGEIEHFEF